ncbi:MAG TPA: glycosyltransferase [Jatrophihabitantaceae bacterium]|jgi:glycosyltransferase involved in cell wall biosynthesis
MTSVIVPAYNEAAVIGRLLDGLLDDARPDEFEVIVVSNGSTDDTVRVARARRDVQVIDLAEPSKHLALIEGDRLATRFPRLYVDADVELDTASARALVVALQTPGIHAVAPERVLHLEDSSWMVRSYFQVWSRLPAVQEGLFGRGVLGVDEQGFGRVSQRPELLGDDLFLHTQFASDERRIVDDSRSVVRAPRTTADLLRRRVRAVQGNAQLRTRSGGRTDTTARSGRTVLSLAAREPRMWLCLPAFFGVTLYARLHACRLRRSGNNDMTWLRDESSRR